MIITPLLLIIIITILSVSSQSIIILIRILTQNASEAVDIAEELQWVGQLRDRILGSITVHLSIFLVVIRLGRKHFLWKHIALKTSIDR